MNSFIYRLSFSLLVCVTLGLLFPLTARCQTEKLGIVKYTPPKGMTKTLKENVVAFSEFDQATGKYCIITVYGATPGTGNPQNDFKREWANLVVKQMTTEETSPKPDSNVADGWTILAGGSAVESGAGKALAFLTVISGTGRTISILAVFNDPAYVKQVDTFIGGIDLEKSAPAGNNNAAAPPMVKDGKLIVPLPARQLTIPDLAGEWGEDASRVSTTYVDRSSGDYRGTDNLSFRSKMTITSNGGYANDFYSIRNGQKEIANTAGSIRLDGRVLSIVQKGVAKYVIRGWLDLPDMTIWVVCGPWFDNDVIPPAIFTNPEQGANLNKTWVRKK